jgi:CBS domain containing-hemolysin-like protein
MKKILGVLLIVLVWASIIVLVALEWNFALIANPWLFYLSLFGLIIFSAVFSSAETAFTILQEDWQATTVRKDAGDTGAKTRLQSWLDEIDEPSWFVRWRHRLVSDNLQGAKFKTLLPFLLVMNNLINLGGMFLIGRGLSVSPAAERLSLVISAVVVVIFGEVVAKFFAFRLPAATASWTVLIIALLKPLLGWYTSRLIVPVEGVLGVLLKKKK